MVERVESVVVGEHDVRVVVEEEGQHVVPLLGDGVMQRCVTLAVLIMTTSQLVHIQKLFYGSIWYINLITEGECFLDKILNYIEDSISFVLQESEWKKKDDSYF